MKNYVFGWRQVNLPKSSPASDDTIGHISEIVMHDDAMDVCHKTTIIGGICLLEG